MSTNHQFIQFSEQAIKKYVKTVSFIVSGYRLNPFNTNEKMDFMLATSDRNFDYETKKVKELVYDDEVLELYSPLEVSQFQRLNRSLIEQGLLKEYEGTTSTISEDNFLSDQQIADLIRIKLPTQLKKAISTIDSLVTLQRILQAAKDKGRAYTIIQAIEHRIDELGSDN